MVETKRLAKKKKEGVKPPKDVTEAVWPKLLSLGRARVSKGSEHLPDYMVPGLLAKGAELIVVYGKYSLLRVVVDFGIKARYYSKTDRWFKNTIKWNTASALRSLQQNVFDAPSLQSTWNLYQTTNSSEVPFSLLSDWREENEKEIKDIIKQASYRGVTQELLEHYNTWKERRNARLMILYSGPDMIPALQELHPGVIKTWRISKNGKKLVIRTNPLKVVLDATTGKELEIGEYTITVHDKIPRMDYFVIRHGGLLHSHGGGSYVGSYMMGEEKEDRDGGYGIAVRGNICFGNHSSIKSVAENAGDVFWIADNLLTLLNQPNFQSENPYAKWWELARGEHPDWGWCENCGLLNCGCVFCVCQEGRHAVRANELCSRCKKCKDGCLCSDCALCHQGKSTCRVTHTVKLLRELPNSLFLRTISLCNKHYTLSVLQDLQSALDAYDDEDFRRDDVLDDIDLYIARHRDDSNTPVKPVSIAPSDVEQMFSMMEPGAE